MPKYSSHRDVFFAFNGPGPYECALCHDPVCAWWDHLDRTDGRSQYCLVIHHLDHNHQNNHPENLVPIHYGCHTAHHRAMLPLVAKGSTLPRAWSDKIAQGTGRRMASMTPDEKADWTERVRNGRLEHGRVPHVCEKCGQGPYRGKQGLSLHQKRDGCTSRRFLMIIEDGRMCELCGRGPFVGTKGLGRHKANGRCVS